MADDCSRLWYLSDSQLVHYFNCTYPQTTPWRLVHLRPAMTSSLIAALQRQRPDFASLLNGPPTLTATGKDGKPSLPLSQSLMDTCLAPPASSYVFSKFLTPASIEGTSPPATTLHSLNAYRTTYGPSPRRLHAWGPLT